MSVKNIISKLHLFLGKDENEKENRFCSVYHANFIFYSWQAIGYFLLTLLLEVLPTCTFTPVAIRAWWRAENFQGGNSMKQPLLKSVSEPDISFEDDIDVQTERNRVLSGSVENAIIYLRNLRKVTPFLDFGLTNYSQLSEFQTINDFRLLVRNVFFAGLSRWKALSIESCCGFFNVLCSGRGMFWFFGDKWGWKNYYTLNAHWYYFLCSERHFRTG